MSIKKYNEKRDFERTPEPSGKKHRDARAKALRFVVQKHRASRLHYDFRLEMDGVLKSWAVPKGPSMDPREKRLAMHVEDHPMDYRLFEGIIPPGNYGAGTVMVWDEGCYWADQAQGKKANEKALLEGLKKGKLTFRLEGSKLQGEFALVKMRGRKGEDNAWLLIKHDDGYSDTAHDVSDQDRSVLSKRSLDEIASDRKRKVWRSDRAETEEAEETDSAGKTVKSAKDGGKTRKRGASEDSTESAAAGIDWAREALDAGGEKAPFPEDASPQLATLVDEPFDREGWLFEIKWDGYRALALHRPGKRGMRLRSRNGKNFDGRFSGVAEALLSLPCEALLDGELVGLDDEGRPDFALVQNSEENVERIVFQVFDLLYLDGVDLRHLPLRERKALLARLLEGVDTRLRYSDHIKRQGKAFFELAAARKLEGIIAKDAEAAYQDGKRTRHWLKIKTEQRQEFLIAGYTAPRRSRSDIGSLILAYHDDEGELHPAGHVGTGMDARTRAELKKKLDRLARKTPPFREAPDTNEAATWTTPKLVCEVRFTEKTADRHLRHPVYLGLREDKDPREIRWESGEDAAMAVRQAEGHGAKKPNARRGRATRKTHPRRKSRGAARTSSTSAAKRPGRTRATASR